MGIARVVWCAIPWWCRAFVFPYWLCVYRRFLADSANLDELRARHIGYCYSSNFIRMIRPRFYLIKVALLRLDAMPVDSAEHEPADRPSLAAWVPDQKDSNLNSTVSV